MNIQGKQLFQKPAFLEEPYSWVQHIPFANYLIEVLKPDTFVELGTHSGNSYFSFCQAVNNLKINTKCFAIDTWEGDDHAGFYDDDVFQRVNQINEENFKQFSVLMRMTFDEGQQYFNDKTIDLLHIDGLHTYEAVKHDFETWLPKMSEKGVVIFHDTNVREREFGVWKLFEELEKKYTAFQFIHGHGLGVVCIGKNVNPEFIEFVKGAQTKPQNQNLFAALGDRVQVKQEKHDLNLKYKESLTKTSELNSIIRKQNKVIADLEELKPQFENQKKLNYELRAQLNDRNKEITKISQTLKSKDAQIDQLNSRLSQKEQEVQSLLTHIRKVKASKSWRITSPLRYVIRKVIVTKQFIKIPLKIGFYALTFNKKKLVNKFKQLKSIYVIKQSGQFDFSYYFEQNPDIRDAKLNGIIHYVEKGALEGRNPNNEFISQAYLSNYPDVAIAGVNPFAHYVKQGVKEDRIGSKVIIDNSTFPNKEFNTFISYNKQLFVANTNPLFTYLEKRVYHGNIPNLSSIEINTFNFPKLTNSDKNKILNSPILMRVAPTQYLLPFQKGNINSLEYNSLSDYLRHAITRPNIIHKRLSDKDMRIISLMDNEKKRLLRSYRNLIQNEKVSIIMPTRNRSNYILYSIISILVQSYINWELIIVDDASEDNTEGIIKTIEDNRITYIKLEERKGNATARNFGLKEANGTIIAYLDDDDQWDPDFLLISVFHMREKGAQMIYSAQLVWTGFNDSLLIGNDFKSIRFSPYNRSLLENANYISMISVLHDKTLINKCGNFNHELDRFVDWDFFLRMTEIETPIALPCILSHYYQKRDNINSISQNEEREKNLNKIHKYLKDRSKRVVFRDDKSRKNKNFYGISKKEFEKRSKILTEFDYETTNILIPNYEAFNTLSQTLDSIYSNTNVSFKITIVDNNSSRETRKKLIRIVEDYENIDLIFYDFARGFSFAINEGLKKLLDENKDILILNNDVIVTPGWLRELKYVLKTDDSAGMVVPRQVLLPGNRIQKPHSPETLPKFEADINLSAHHKNVHNPYYSGSNGFVELNFAPLFCNLIRNSTAKELGKLDVGNGPHFRSDWIYCDNLRRWTNKRIIYNSFSKVYHLQGISTKLRV